MINNKNSKGFTLIELLVVISIIGVLSSVVLASLNVARAKARDARRVSDIREIQKALELYYDQNGRYPLNTESGGSWYSGWLSTTPGCYNTIGGRIVASGLVSGGFISQLPMEPKPDIPSNLCYLYITDATGMNYKLLVHETMEYYSPTHSLADPGWTSGGNPTLPCVNARPKSYSVSTPGGRCY